MAKTPQATSADYEISHKKITAGGGPYTYIHAHKDGERHGEMVIEHEHGVDPKQGRIHRVTGTKEAQAALRGHAHNNYSLIERIHPKQKPDYRKSEMKKNDGYLNRVDNTAPPAYADGVEDLFKSWNNSEPLVKTDPQIAPDIKSEKEAYSKRVKRKTALPKMKGPVKRISKTEKAELKGPKSKAMGGETHSGSPRQEAGDVLSIVSRKAKERLQEKMGEKKARAAYTKSELDKATEKMEGEVMSAVKRIKGEKEEVQEVLPTVSQGNRDNVLAALRSMSKTDMPNHGKSYKQLDDAKAGKDMTVEEAKNLHQSPNWSSKDVMPLIHPEKRDEALKHFNHRPVKKSESIDWESTEAKPKKLFKR